MMDCIFLFENTPEIMKYQKKNLEEGKKLKFFYTFEKEDFLF